MKKMFLTALVGAAFISALAMNPGVSSAQSAALDVQPGAGITADNLNYCAPPPPSGHRMPPPPPPPRPGMHNPGHGPGPAHHGPAVHRPNNHGPVVHRPGPGGPKYHRPAPPPPPPKHGPGAHHRPGPGGPGHASGPRW